MAPENTQPSFALAAALGATYLELDVHATTDGTIVVMHDDTLDRTTDGTGPVSAQRWAQLETLDAGYTFTTDGQRFPYRGQGVGIPTLESVLRSFPDRYFNIEIKQAEPPIVRAVVDILERTQTTVRSLLAAESDPIMQAIRATVGGQIATGMSSSEAANFMARVFRSDWDDYTAPGQALQIPPVYQGIDLISTASITAAHRFGMEVHVWTVNDRTEIEQMLELGVDGIMSDLPSLVATAVKERRSG